MLINHDKTIEDWLKNTKQGPNGCLEWMGFLNEKGYARANIDYKNTQLARWIGHLSYGFDLKNKKIFVCHTCDNPKCINPQHLYVGDAKSNSIDKVVRNRLNPNPPLGEAHGMSKLSKKQVLEIRSNYKVGEPYLRLAKKYNVSSSLIGMIINRKIWKHI